MNIEQFFAGHPSSPAAAFTTSLSNCRPSTLPQEVREAANLGLLIFPVSPIAKLTGSPNLLIAAATCEIQRLEELATEYSPCEWRVAIGPSSLCVLQLVEPEGRNSFAVLSQDQEECLRRVSNVISRQIAAYTSAIASKNFSGTAMKRAGRICQSCKASLPLPHTPGEKLCEHCSTPIKTHRVFMSFMFHEGGWRCLFWEADLKRHIPRMVTFREPGKIRETAERGHCDHEARQAFDLAIESGQGSLWLNLSNEQYLALRGGIQ
ncbi:MAG: hypothetical protein ABR905_07665 [Terracidiphilus sp.]|jgi:hypothetical protein